VPQTTIDLPPGRIVVAMSGGVDSAVAAGLLARAGHDVVGITLQLYDHGAAVGRAGTCCAGRDIADARRVADRLAIPHYVLDYEARFRKAVIEDFADSYARGETPVPCIRCNERIKFHDLLGVAEELGAIALATGHYVQRIEGPDGPEMHRGADGDRDQSYFLFATKRAQLARLRFPLGGMRKAETREIARELGLPVAEKADSQDICFVPSGSYARLVERLRPEAAEPGEIVDLQGRVIGRHEGFMRYTVGQRRGIGIAAAEPLYVVRLEPAARRVVVGPASALGRNRIALEGMNWLGSSQLAVGQEIDLEVRLRSTQPLRQARVTVTAQGRAEVALAEPDMAVAPGQACVFYRGSQVLGGGWIKSASSAAAAA
jgi:tRNA-uridine 2-sulfurtransferase